LLGFPSLAGLTDEELEEGMARICGVMQEVNRSLPTAQDFAEAMMRMNRLNSGEEIERE
jgi:hypothetical protein